MISYNLAVLNQFVERFIVMKNSAIVHDFPKYKVFSNNRHPYIQKLLSLYVE